MRESFVKALCQEAKKNKNIYLITGDLGFGVLNPFIDEFGGRFINAGISEQNMTGVAAGMSMQNNIVFTYSIGNFSTMRCLEQIRNDCCYNNLNVKIICVGSGFTYGSLGMSHHATEDLGIMRSLPNIYIFSPGDPFEAAACTKLMCEIKGTCYMRLGRGGATICAHEAPIESIVIGQPLLIKKGKKVCVFYTGDIYDEIFQSIETLNKYGVFPTIYSVPIIKPIDSLYLSSIVSEYDLIVTIEEHNIINGMGTAITEALIEQNVLKRIIKIGINDNYCTIVGNQKYLRDQYNINSETIIKKIMEAVNGH